MHQAQWSGAAAVSAAASARAQPCCAGVRGGWRWCRRGRCTLSCGSRFLQTWACPGTPYSGHSLARGMRRTHRSGSCAVQSCERTSARRREARRKNDSLPLLQHHLLPPRPKRAVEARQWRSLVVEAVGGERGGEGSPPPPPPAPPLSSGRPRRRGRYCRSQRSGVCVAAPRASAWRPAGSRTGPTRSRS
eukprot:scaffold29723_cov37-Tisochrysis_lutea.AAC.2